MLLYLLHSELGFKVKVRHGFRVRLAYEVGECIISMKVLTNIIQPWSLCGVFDHLFLQGLQKKTSTKSFQILLHPSVSQRGESESMIFIYSFIHSNMSKTLVLATCYS